MSEKYVTKAEILQWANVQRPKLTAAGIPDLIMNKGHRKVDAELVRNAQFVIPTRSDRFGFLRNAAAGFILALLCKTGIITQTSGEIMSTEFGEVRYQFQKTHPMFFFASGSSKPFQELLPYETLRNYAYSFIRAYLKWRFYKRTGKKFPKAKMARDATSRGAYWNESIDNADVADAVFGETLSDFYEDW